MAAGSSRLTPALSARAASDCVARAAEIVAVDCALCVRTPTSASAAMKPSLKLSPPLTVPSGNSVRPTSAVLPSRVSDSALPLLLAGNWFGDTVIASLTAGTPVMSSWKPLKSGCASGGYEPVAEVLFNRMPVDGYFMEWDTDRAGGFEPLRFLPKGKHVVLGLVTSKTGSLEKADDVKKRIDEASKFAAKDQLCLSPQCGFASTEEGNTLAEDEQWRKMEMIVNVARDVWGDV